MQLATIFTKLMAIDSQVPDLQSKNESATTTADRKPDQRDDSNRPAWPIRDQKLLTLYKAMDMGA